MASSAAFILYFMGSLLNKMQKYLDVRVLVYYEGVNLFCQGGGRAPKGLPITTGRIPRNDVEIGSRLSFGQFP